MINVFLNIKNFREKVGKLVCSNKKIYFQYDNNFLNKNINISPICHIIIKYIQTT